MHRLIHALGRLLLLGFLVHSPSLAKELRPKETLPLVMDGVLRVPVVTVEIGGEKIPCLLDTGAYRTTFDTGLLRRLFPEKTRIKPTDTAHTDVLQLTLPALGLGTTTHRDLAVFETDLSHITRVSPSGIRGILGMDVLARAPFCLSFDRHTLTLHDSEFPSEIHRVESIKEGDRFLARVKLDATSAFMLIDTGANRTQLAASDWHGPKSAGFPTRMRHLGGGENAVRTEFADVAELRLGACRIPTPHPMISDFSLLGVDCIGGGDWHFDPETSRVWWRCATPPMPIPNLRLDPPAPSPPARTTRKLPFAR